MSSTTKYLPLVLGIVAAVGMLFGMRLERTLEYDGILNKADVAQEQSIVEALQHIKSKYYGDLSYPDFTNKVLSHMIDELDPYSHYFPQSKDADYNRYVNGLYEGIGLEYFGYQDSLYIVSIIPDGPVAATDIQRGDVLLAIDSIDLVNGLVTLDSLRNLNRRAAGTAIQLTVWHRQTQSISVYDLIVGDVSLPLVKSFIIEGPTNVAYIRIERFYKGVFRDFMDELDRYHMDSIAVRDLIIDLRGNLGGVVDETIKLLNQFFAEKEVVLLSTEDNKMRSQIYNSNGRIFMDMGRIVILIDERSASASEIMAAVLQDHDRAVILGSNSFGKGVIQQNYHLSNEGSINLTIGAYRLPSGRLIGRDLREDTSYYTLKNNRLIPQGIGVTPDIVVTTCSNAHSTNLDIPGIYVAERLWEPGALQAYLSIQYPHVLPAISDTCTRWELQEKNWELLDFVANSGAKIEDKHLDGVILRALGIIRSDDYEAILEGGGVDSNLE